MIELWLSVDHGRAPDTYAEFLLRTSGKTAPRAGRLRPGLQLSYPARWRARKAIAFG